MAFSKITTKAMSGDTLEAGDIAANAVGASELADNAVDTAAIADLSVTNAKLPSNIIPVKPHIQPGTLQPAVAGKLLDGTTNHSGAYGTAQSDGRSYYYTDIKGSKPIKDPRIGAHFGSQRHKFSSLQLLEQETATHGKNVYSLDGRNWIRAYTTSTKNFVMENGTHGAVVLGTSDCAGVTLEIVGFFNNFNMISKTATNQCDDIGVTVNGGTERDSADTGKLFGDTTVNSPLGSRYVPAGSVINHGDSNLTTDLGTTPKINTLKITAKTGASEYVYTYGIELIAQDTTSTANKSKIQIPSQNVVSYGKKFTVSGTPHYDPFNGFTNGTTLFSAKVDTATSLGLGTGTTWGAPWAISSSNHIRPYNGGRVVKWVDSSGTIKTSVTMMPPNAQNIKTTASNEITTASATNTHTINFSDDAVDHSLSEVAKRFHIREFGNGSANAGTGGSYPDISMAHGTQENRRYIMDDGLTYFGGNLVKNSSNDKQSTYIQGDNGFWHHTFIGTGITIIAGGYGAGNYKIAINLPYGTHILRCLRDADGTPDYTLDGIALDDVTGNTYGDVHEIDIYQPKKPPVPEDACILADYMLMADFVGIPAGTAGTEAGQISKGTRFVSPSRDMLYNTPNNSFTFGMTGGAGGYPVEGSYIYTGIGTTSIASLPFFGVNASVAKYASRTLLLIDGETSETGVTNRSSPGGNWYNHSYKTTNLTPGQYTVHHKPNGNNHWNHGGTWIASPTHTSSHYQPFETPYLKELIGGDRNMEQTNLVVTHDGKTWDEVTRDTSYIGNKCVECNTETDFTWANPILFDQWRGSIDGNGVIHFTQKDFAIGHNRIICLVAGQYKVVMDGTFGGSGTRWVACVMNSDSKYIIDMTNDQTGSTYATYSGSRIVEMDRGDWVSPLGDWGRRANDIAFQFSITRV